MILGESGWLAGVGVVVGVGAALAEIDLYRPNRDAFASTLTSLDDATLC
jgi:hypothetical protein